MDLEQVTELYRYMLTARNVDELEEQAVRRGEAFFHVAGSGHEGCVALAPHLVEADYLHLHYRSKALMLARGSSPQYFFDMLFCKDVAGNRGRQMSAHLSDADRNVLSIPGPVGNSGLQAVGIAAAIAEEPARPIVVCGIGDGSTQQGEFLESLGEAARRNLPVLFFVEDNQWAISTSTAGKTFFSIGGTEPDEFHGIRIHRIDGRDVVSATAALEPIVAGMRAQRRPEIVIFRVERLTSHTNADDHTIYRTAGDLQEVAASGDVIIRMEQYLLQHGCDEQQLQKIRDEVSAEVAACEERAYQGADPQAILTAKQPINAALTKPIPEPERDACEPLTMKDAIREVLHHKLSTDQRVVMLGEDIEDPKGDVFGLTRGLSTEFPGRVQNSPLSESTIVGTSVGRALAGQCPVAFIQFADFLPLALNQIMLDLGTMWWRTDGAWTTPVIVMVPCGGYRPGLGPFHSHSIEAVLAHTPGLDVFMPSSAEDAAGMLNAAFESGRPTIFFYPKAALNDPQRATTVDVRQHITPIGSSRKVRSGQDITFVAWGNTVRLCQTAAAALDDAAIDAEIIDLRSISPWDEQAVLASAEKTGRVVVVHEDNHTCGVGGEVLATIAEKSRVPVAVRRVTRADTYVPCNFANQLEVLPSARRVLTVAAEMLGLTVQWQEAAKSEHGLFALEAIGSGPSDETVIIADLFVSVGDRVEKGSPIAELEATKGVFDLYSPVSGTVEELAVAVGDTVDVGGTMMQIRIAGEGARARPMTQENFGKPKLTGAPRRLVDVNPRPAQTASAQRRVGLATVATVTGEKRVNNTDLKLLNFKLNDQDVVRRTGIESRCWAGEGQDAISMGQAACRKALVAADLQIDQVDLVLCSTTTPVGVSPSMACRIVDRLAPAGTDAVMPAYDINAACSGYLFALQNAYDFLQSVPHGRVMIVTTELLSPLLNPDDPDTAIIFGDAASATLVYGEEHFEHTHAQLRRPELSGKAEDGTMLSVPQQGGGYIQMQGRKVFSQAVRHMMSSLTRACHASDLEVGDLKMVIPHQANERIVDAVRNRLEVDVFSNIQRLGNTSSTSIPLCLEEVLPRLSAGEQVGICAFGAGFTFGAAVLEKTAAAENVVGKAA